jgi:transporter family-2 protein
MEQPIMQAIILVVIIGLIGGVAVGFQTPLTNMIGQRLGILESAFIIQLGGAIGAAIPLLFHRGGNLMNWQTVPWYALGRGVLGIFVLVGINFTFPRLGAVATTFLIVTGQLVISVLLDHFGLLGAQVRPIDLTRILGIAVLFFGVWLIVR